MDRRTPRSLESPPLPRIFDHPRVFVIGELNLSAPPLSFGTALQQYEAPIWTALVDPLEDVDQLGPLVDEWWLTVTSSWRIATRHELFLQHSLPWDSLHAEVISRAAATPKINTRPDEQAW